MMLFLMLTLAQPPKMTYMEGYDKAIKEQKKLFVWRGIKDDYVIAKNKDAVHVFDPDLKAEGVPDTFIIKKGVIVCSPDPKVKLRVDVQTADVNKINETKPKRIVENVKFYDLFPNGTKIPCQQCNQGR